MDYAVEVYSISKYFAIASFLFHIVLVVGLNVIHEKLFSEEAKKKLWYEMGPAQKNSVFSIPNVLIEKTPIETSFKARYN